MEAYLEYLRKSRADDPTEPTELTLQRHRQYLEEKVIKPQRLPVVKVFEEVVTGDSLFMRPQMLELLEAVETGEYAGVICMDIDRLGRGDMKDQGIILETFKWSGTKIVTPERTYDLSNDSDEEMAEFKTFFSRREYKTITKRLQRGLHQTIQDGGYIANAPYGYTKTTVEKIPSLQINEEEAYFVRMMFDMYVRQGVGCQAIADALNSLGAKPHRSQSFGRTSVMHILRNPVFMGKVVWDRKKHIRKGQRGNEKHITIYQPTDKWTVVDGVHPPIIDEITFLWAQEIFKRRYHPPSNDGSVKNPLAGLIRCGKCGYLLQMRHPYEKVPYMLCATKGCNAAAKLEYVEESLLEYLYKRMTELEVQVAKRASTNTVAMKKALEMIRKNLAAAENQKDHLYELLEQGVYTVDVFLHRSAAVDQKITDLKVRESEQLEAICYANCERETRTIQKIKSVLQAYVTAPDAKTKNDLLKSIVSQAVYNKEKKSSPKDLELNVELKDV